MTEIQNSKQYDLEERTFRFAKRVSEFSKTVPRTLENIEYRKQFLNLEFRNCLGFRILKLGFRI